MPPQGRGTPAPRDPPFSRDQKYDDNVRELPVESLGVSHMGEQKVVFEDIKEGDKAPAISHTLTRTDLVQYAGASGDFNPMHHDEVKAKAAGLPSVFGHGMFSMGLLAAALNDYLGVGSLTEYKVRFAKQTWPDDVLTTA